MTATRRSPDEYNWRELEFDARPLPNLSSRSSARTEKIQFVVVHHMTIVGKGTGSALDACIATWKNREASAHYGVDGKLVAQFVWDNLAAWATATRHGNHAGISIEHANSTNGLLGWKVGDDTWHTGAKLAAYLHVAYKLGRPVAGKTLRQHSDFFPTACAGPYLGKKIWADYVAEVQRVYDAIIKGLPVDIEPEPKPEPEPVPSTDRMDPAAYFIGARGHHVTWLGERLIAHGFNKHHDGDGYQPGPVFTEYDRDNVADFQRAQGWEGSDADGFPGAESLKRLAADPVKPTPKTVEVVSAIQNMAGNNATGIKTAKSRMARYVAARKASPVHIINAQETTVASTVRPRLDSGLKPLGYSRAGGGKGRYCYARGVKVIDAGLFTVPSKYWFKRDDKQAAWVVYEIDGARGMDVSLHLESDSGSVADGLRVKQAQYIATAALAKAKALKVPEQNVMLSGDTNSEGMVLEALTEGAGWRNVAAGSRFEKTYTFMGWDGRSRKRFDYALVRADAAEATLEAVAHDTKISDHAGLRVRRHLIK